MNMLLAFLLMIFPMILVLGCLVWYRKRYDNQAEKPFTEPPLRPAGEALSVKIDDIVEKAQDKVIFLIGISIIGDILLQATGQKPGTVISLFILVLIISIWVGVQLVKLMKELLNHRLGLLGERVVGECLNQLMLQGHRVFHDLPFDGFNIDHVVVGPSGIFAVETKAHRKLKDKKGRKESRVLFDGKTLQWPGGFVDNKAPEQAVLNAKTLWKWLSEATGDKIWVDPVLVIPGWYVERKANGGIAVLNEKEIGSFLSSKPSNKMSAEQIQRAVYQLSQKCRLAV